MNQESPQRRTGDPDPGGRGEPARQPEKPTDERPYPAHSGEGAETALKRMKQLERGRASASAGPGMRW